MTAATLAKLIGRAALLTVEPSARAEWWRVPVTISDARERFGNPDLFVSPADGTIGAGCWVSAERVAFPDNSASIAALVNRGEI